jgi:hypothetical protein
MSIHKLINKRNVLYYSHSYSLNLDLFTYQNTNEISWLGLKTIKHCKMLNKHYFYFISAVINTYCCGMSQSLLSQYKKMNSSDFLYHCIYFLGAIIPSSCVWNKEKKTMLDNNSNKFKYLISVWNARDDFFVLIFNSYAIFSNLHALC